MRVVRAIAAAWSLLTIVPLPRALGRRLDADDWSRSGAAFPLVGLLLGAVLALIAVIGVDAVGALTAAAVTVVASALLTAGLHLDGFADCCDALGARGTGEAQRRRRLDILRDSATGAYGTLGLGSILLLQTTTISGLALAGNPCLTFALALALPLGRMAGVLHVALLRPARVAGLGASFGVRRTALLIAALSTLLIGAALTAAWLADRHELAAIEAPAAALLGATLGLAITTRLARTKLGGRTGDTIGATIVLAETLALLGFLAAA